MSRGCVARAFAAFLAGASLLAPSLAGQERPTFRSGIDVIVIDINVVDRSHQPVDGLHAADFIISVDGKRRKVVSAQFVSYGARTSTTRETQRVAVSAPPAASVAAAHRGRTVIIVVDNDSLEPGDGLLASRAADRLLDQLTPDDRVGVATIPWLRHEVTMTDNRDAVRVALAGVISGSERFDPSRFSGHNVGLAEAFAVERGEAEALQRIFARECGRAQSQYCHEEVKALVRQVQLDAHLRGARSLEGLRDLGIGLKQIEGPKTMVLVSGGAPRPDIRTVPVYSQIAAAFAAAQVTLYTIYIGQPQLGQVKNRLSPTFAEDPALEREGVENATSAAGGTFTEAIGSLEQSFERIAKELSGAYLVGIEVEAVDRDGKPHRVEVEVNRKDVDVRARRQYVITPVKATAAMPSPRAHVAAPSPPPDSRASDASAVEAATDLHAVLSRVVQYVADYRRQYSAVVADEDYRQETPRAQVHLRSDVLLVKTPDPEGWVSFRDVYEVDGVAVRDRDDRLKKLFLDPSIEATAQLRKIKEESARYNIGDVVRNVNVPLFPLIFLDPANVPRFEFKMGGRRESKGVRVWEIRYAERQRPTIVTNTRASGWFLVDQARGAVVQTGTYYVDSLNQSAEIVVQYAQDATIGMWVPSEMNEVYLSATGRLLVKGTAMYSRLRRFQVTTEEKIKNPS